MNAACLELLIIAKIDLFFFQSDFLGGKILLKIEDI